MLACVNKKIQGEEDERERERFQIWNSIQLDKKEKNEKPGQFDIWSSILTQKGNEEASKLSAPYIHPLVKRSKSCMSEKSLEICTESLGSETGSDGFSSETGDSEEEELQLEAPKYNYSVKKKSLKRCFPPPLPSLSRRQHGGPSLHMRPHRDNGRLFLQAVSVPSQNNFLAQRQDGRLVLTFASEDEEEKDDVEEESVGFEEEEDESVIEKALMMNKPIGLVNKSSKWLENFNEVPRTSVFNAYDYYSLLKKNNIRSKVVVSGNLNINQISNDTQQLLVLRGREEWGLLNSQFQELQGF